MRFLFFLTFLISLGIRAQSTCANAPLINSGSCLSNQTFPGSVNMAGLCVGGSNPAIYIKFVAGSCAEFTIISSANVSTIGSQILTSSCAAVAGTLECHDNVIANVPFAVNGISATGTNLLTPGATYVLRLWGPVPASTTFSICYAANQTANTSDECIGAITLGSAPITAYNGGDCQYTGSYTNAGAADQPAANLCAGSLENTQWIKFTPQAGALNFTLAGSNVQCTGGGCGFQLGIFSGSCGSLLFEGCYGNKVCSGGQSVQGPTNNNASDGYSLTWNAWTATSYQVTVTRTTGLAFTGTETFYLVMDGNADADCSYTLFGSNLIALPIEFISFTAYLEERGVKLVWYTASEKDSDYFLVERSIDGEHFEQVAKVSAMGSSFAIKGYAHTDFDLASNTYYYRLSLMETTGEKTYFNIIAVDVISEASCIPLYYNLNGVEVDFENCPAGIYIKRCGPWYKKIWKN